MILKDNKIFKLPRFMTGSFMGADRFVIPNNNLILREVMQREDNGNIELVCHAKNGPEEKRGGVRFSITDRAKKDKLFNWLKQQVGKDIATIYDSTFSF